MSLEAPISRAHTHTHTYTHLQDPVVLQRLLGRHPDRRVPIQTSSDEVQEQHVVGLNRRGEFPCAWASLTPLGVRYAPGVPSGV